MLQHYILHTFPDNDVTLKIDSVSLWEIEHKHGEEFGLGGASEAVVGELGHDGGVQGPGSPCCPPAQLWC